MAKTIGIVAVAALAASAAGSPLGRNKDGHGSAREFSCQRRQPIVFAECPTVFDHHGLAFEEAAFAEAATERDDQMRALIRRPGAEKPDHRHRRLLRTRRKRPRHRPA